MNDSAAILGQQGGLEYLGLAPFLRASIAGADLRQATQQMLQELAEDSSNPNLLMNLAIAVQCLNQKELGLGFMQEALSLQATYVLPARVQPARLRLLVLATQGSIQANTPLECLLEVSDIELVLHYIEAGEHMLADVPAHDVLFVGISDSDANRPLLKALQKQLEGWSRPVLNAPQYIPHTGRDQASSLLSGIPQLLAPPTVRVSVADLYALVMGQTGESQLAGDCSFPIILRPVGSQAGADLQKIDNAAEVAHYLAGLEDTEFFLAPFIDYSDAEGQFRKIRIAFIKGQAFVCHMGISSNWMIHYVNAGMYEDDWKRQEEARFMRDFPDFVQRHRAALDTICQRMQLDYLVMDCAETRDGELLLFEIDHGGVVHAMDVEQIFPYKNEHIHKAQMAFRELLYGLLPRTVSAGL
ncbi:hypothetical protein DIC66_01540 [Rhodoferax lacus]|uniref:RimK family alpha-L-glutamate ligase n=1 Tax=Rhodoferax lacus TaxID=2184758 RepID=A0A3E1RGT8_9BURK|nr:hypothetical protein [Rhodoferax lacus]RFO98596.1 hypothetical protein DIC66_01540 [Rhodoferax lacus]